MREPAPGAARTVVVVEDDPDLQFLTMLMLSRAGYVVRSYGDAREAVPACLETPPDAIVLDWMLPGMTGIEALRALRRDPRTAGVPVVMATACDTSDHVAAALRSGAQALIGKPFPAAELTGTIDALVGVRVPEVAAAVA